MIYLIYLKVVYAIYLLMFHFFFLRPARSIGPWSTNDRWDGPSIL